jgi:hypothetical protein
MRRCVRCSTTASSPAASASTLLPVPARPPRLTMPIDGSASTSMARRCSAERPRTPKRLRSPRTRCARLSAWTRARAEPDPFPTACRTRPVWQGSSRGPTTSEGTTSEGRSTTRSANSSSRTAVPTSSSHQPVQPSSTANSLRYSSAPRPATEARSRSGRSFDTTTASAPSAARLRATARMRWSLSAPRNASGRPAASAWFSSMRTVPPCSLTATASVSEPCSSRRSSSSRRARRAAHPSSGWWRFASSSASTTIGSTTSCSSKRRTASGSASRTDVSRTYVRTSVRAREGAGVVMGETPSSGGRGGPTAWCPSTTRPPQR